VILSLVLLWALWSCTSATETTPTTGTDNLTTSSRTTSSTSIASTQSMPPVSTVSPATLNRSIVQVWDAETLVATGIVVGDGSQVLTAVDFEETVSETLNVITPAGDDYTASIQNMDPRTGAALLQVGGLNLTVAATDDPSVIVQDQPLTATWYGQAYSQGDPREPELKRTDMLASLGDPREPVAFGVHFPQSTFVSGDIPYIRPGAVFTDGKGLVIGILGPDYNTLFPHPHAIGGLPWVARIDVALEMLSPDFAERTYADGPLMIVINNESGGAYLFGYFNNYDMITQAFRNVERQLGVPLSGTDLPANAHTVTDNPADGNMVTVVYAHPVDITSSNGNLIAAAKWVSVQWGRSGEQPNRLFYGDGRLNLKGGFDLTGDISDLLSAVDKIGYP
jgi:hypothetical protein